MSEGGFPKGVRWTPVPDLFFSEYLQDRISPSATRVFLHLLWRIHRRTSGAPPALRLSDLTSDETLRRGVDTEQSETASTEARAEVAPADSDDPMTEDLSLDRAIQELETEGLVLTVRTVGDEGPDTWLLVNAEEGRRAVERWHSGGLVLPDLPPLAARDSIDRATVFSLYEENIGMLTPMIAEELEEAQEQYSADWMVDAFRIAVEQNARSWAYVKGILERWAREGRGDETDRRSDKAAREKDIEGPYSSYVEH